jgi:hypothetical protein
MFLFFRQLQQAPQVFVVKGGTEQISSILRISTPLTGIPNCSYIHM